MLVDVDGVDNIVYMALADRVENLGRALAELLETACADTIIAQELRSAARSLDIEAKLVEAADKRQSTLLVGIGDRYEDSTVVYDGHTRRLQRLVERTA